MAENTITTGPDIYAGEAFVPDETGAQVVMLIYRAYVGPQAVFIPVTVTLAVGQDVLTQATAIAVALETAVVANGYALPA